MARNVLKHARADVTRTEKQLGMIFKALEPHVSAEEFEKSAPRSDCGLLKVKAMSWRLR
jgi:hypothetical protein